MKRGSLVRPPSMHRSSVRANVPIPLLELTEEERNNIMHAQEFARFVDDSSKIIQRALNDGYDYVRDYRITIDDIQ